MEIGGNLRDPPRRRAVRDGRADEVEDVYNGTYPLVGSWMGRGGSGVGFT